MERNNVLTGNGTGNATWSLATAENQISHILDNDIKN